MRRISTLFQTIKDLNNDRWVRKYNPHEQFFVDVDWYDTEEECLNALRDDWKSREFDSCLRFFTNQIAQNVDYINAFEFFYCQICENKCTNMG